MKKLATKTQSTKSLTQWNTEIFLKTGNAFTSLPLKTVHVRKNQNHVVPTLTANQGEGGHNVCLVKTKFGIRKMTPHECFNTQGFPQNFVLPSDMAESRLYKQAGNSVCVSVIQRIAEKIIEIL